MTEFIIPPPKFIKSFDAARIATFEMGRSDKPPLFLVNGLGGNLVAWRLVVGDFLDEFRVISYDYRGMYLSPTPSSGDFSMEAHIRDAVAVMEHFDVTGMVLMGWSMGVQVVLELAERVPERIRALVLANGAFGKPLDRAMPRLKPLAMLTMGLLARCADFIRPAATPVLATPAPLKLAKTLGIVSKQLDEQVFLDLARDYANLDFKAYRDCVDALVNHDAQRVLSGIRVPTLIIGGGRDFFTPRSFSQEMADRISNSELHIIDDASHYCCVEYPNEIIRIMRRFLTDKVRMRLRK
jgi:pimeloyl-ACP methyl ester carboxylesterase